MKHKTKSQSGIVVVMTIVSEIILPLQSVDSQEEASSQGRDHRNSIIILYKAPRLHDDNISRPDGQSSRTQDQTPSTTSIRYIYCSTNNSLVLAR